MGVAIKVDTLGKKYRIGKQQRSYKTLRETMEDAFFYPIRKLSQSLKNSPQSH